MYIIERAGQTLVFLKYKRLLSSIPRLHYFFSFSQTESYLTSLSKQDHCFYSFFLELLLLLFLAISSLFVWIDFTYVKSIHAIPYIILLSPHRTTDSLPSHTGIKNTCFLVLPYFHTSNATLSSCTSLKTIFQSSESRLILSSLTS